MSSAQLILLESDRAGAASLAPILQKKGYTVRVEYTARQALRALQHFSPDLVIIDAASLRSSGARIARRIRATTDGTPILVVAENGAHLDPRSGASLVLNQPFTPRKLLNGVARLLPLEESNCIKAGPIKLNLAQRRVSCGSREEKLTPKQAHLLEVFMHNPGQLLSRKYLINHVWETDFLGDTRTLDVHISWLRHVIEPNPSRPRYLKTIRGSGYRLDVPEEGKK